MKNITFITTGQPTTNPRLVKEAELLIRLGYNVKVIYCFYQAWAASFDNDIIGRHPAAYICCGGDPFTSNKIYFKTRLKHKICRYLFKFFKSYDIPEQAISRTHHEAVKLAKKLKSDIYIAHNLGALPAAVSAARYNKARVGYDAEDIHSEQQTTGEREAYLLNKFIEVKYFPLTDYFTAASPQIAAFYKKAYPYLHPVTVNNVFSKRANSSPSTRELGSTLKLFWFSQTIGSNRGLDYAFNALNVLKDANIELHLLGNLPPGEFKDELLNSSLINSKIFVHTPVAADDIPEFASGFDVGLALEPGFNVNNDFALSNKIFTYLQAGLTLIATDTTAQAAFIKAYPDAGEVFSRKDTGSLETVLLRYLNDPQLLIDLKEKARLLGQTDINWEKESEKFLIVLNETLTVN